MEGQFGAPFHFAVEFLVLVVAAGGAFDAVRARRTGAGLWSIGQASGFAAIAVAEFLHGAQVTSSESDVVLLVLRTLGFGLLAVTAKPSAAIDRIPLEPIIGLGAAPALFLPGAHAGYAIVPAAVAIAVAGRGWYAHRLYREPTTFFFTMAFLGFALAEAATAIAGSASNTWLVVAHAARVAGALFLARWLWTPIVRSVRLRFVAVFVAVLTVAVLVVSAALNVVIGSTLQNNELRRLEEAGVARAATIQGDLGRSALVAGQATAGSEAVRNALQARAGVPTLGQVFRVLNLDFIMLVAPTRAGGGVVLSSAAKVQGKPFCTASLKTNCNGEPLPATEEISIAGSNVVAQALQGVFGESIVPVSFANSKGTVQSQILVVAAFQVRGNGGKVIGSVVDGFRIDRRYLLGVADSIGEGAQASVLVGDRLSATTFKRSAAVNEAFQGLNFTLPRENGTVLKQIVSIGGTRYVSAFVPLRASDGRVIGMLALSRENTGLASAQRNITRTLFLITLVTMIFAAILAWLSGGRVTRPIRALTSAARQLRAGHLQTRTAVSSDDEVGSLGTAFNEMADELQRQTGQLQRSAATEATLRARMEAILQSMGDGLIATDTGGTVVTYNRAAEEILGRRAQHALRRPLDEVMKGQTIIGRTLSEAAMIGGVTEGILQRADGSSITVALTAAPLRDASGSPVGRVVVLRDISREHEAERMKSEFLANVSHELRTPITPIKGYAEMMVRKKFPRAKEETFLRGILDSTDRLERVVEILVDFAAMEAGRLKPQVEPVPVRDLLERATQKWAARDGEHRFVRKVENGVRPILGDAKLLGRSLDELLDNAVKFSPDGGRIEVTAEPYTNGSRGKSQNKVRITVRDHGIGIEAGQVPELFQDFRQLDGSDTRSYGGLGLGLAYVKRIADVHGGDVQVESKPGRGSAFSLVLPAAARGAKAAPKRAAPTRAASTRKRR